MHDASATGDEIVPASSHEIKQLDECPLLAVTDFALAVVSMIIAGKGGEQHRVNTFNFSKRDPIFSTNRAGNTKLEYNMNSHLRNGS